MYSDNKQIRDVADVAAKIMYGQQPVTEKLHPNQQQLDVHEPEKDELTSDDFKKLRAKKEVKKEEVEELDELSKDTLGSYIKKANYAGGMADFKHGRIADRRGDSKEKTALAATSHKRTKGISTAVDKLSKEEVESIDEVKMADLPSTKVQGRSYGASKPEPSAFDVLKGPKDKELKDIEAEKKKKQKKFSEMVNLYQEKGLKSLSEMLVKEEVEELNELSKSTLSSYAKKGALDSIMRFGKASTMSGNKKPDHAEADKAGRRYGGVVKAIDRLVKEEPDNEQFTKELEDAKAKSEGKKKNTEIAKGSVQAVKQEELDINDINGVQMSTIEERMMTEPEKEKKEDIVKGMKKGMAGFKDRYGDRAKDVMYATATKQAMK